MPGGAPASRSFHGNATINAATAKVRLVALADEIIALLVSDPGATVNINVEIHAEFPNGVPAHIKRAVSENANALALKSKNWE